jgi:alkylation response protein AidB-like acyl-CoA dehydrogenase
MRIVYLSTPIRQKISPDLSTFGTNVLTPHTFSLVADAERHTPSVSTHTTFGHPVSTLHTGLGWRSLQNYGIEQGIVAIPYEGDYGSYGRLYQFIKYHLWTGSSVFVTCPSAMSDGAASLMRKYAFCEGVGDERQRVFREAYRNLTSRQVGRAWTSGQWMTERSGGSDVRGLETVATMLPPPTSSEEDVIGDTDAQGMPLGPWSIKGFKWFSSATDADMAVLLARTAKGITLFYAPMRRCTSNKNQDEILAPANQECESNGITIQRLKPKLGTRALPTAELVLNGTRAWIIGEEGQGVREMATVLNITRIHTGLSALGLWGRGLAISRAFARVRKVDGGKLLMDMPAHVKSMAGNEVNYAGMMQLGFFTVALLGVTENSTDFDARQTLQEKEGQRTIVKDIQQASLLLRLLTPVMKAQCSKSAIFGLQECMESLGGIGYLEDEQEFNIARLFRDANVLSIWEGTTDVMAHDVVRVMKGREGEKVRKALNEWITGVMRLWSRKWDSAKEVVRTELGRVEELWTQLEAEELKFRGRELLESLAWIVAAVLLIEDGERDGDEVASERARRWISKKGADDSVPAWEDAVVLNRRLVFGQDGKVGSSRL